MLVTSSPKELAGGVGSLRGVTHNLAAAVPTAVVGALLSEPARSAIFPCSWLPDHKPDEIPSEPPNKAERG